MLLGLSESQDTILLHILFSDYYLIYLFFDRPIFSKHQNIGTVFLPTVIHDKLPIILQKDISGDVEDESNEEGQSDVCPLFVSMGLGLISA